MHPRNTSLDIPLATLHITHEPALGKGTQKLPRLPIKSELCSLLLSGSMNLQVFYAEHNFGQMGVNHVPYSHTLRGAPCLLGHIPGKSQI